MTFCNRVKGVSRRQISFFESNRWMISDIDLHNWHHLLIYNQVSKFKILFMECNINRLNQINNNKSYVTKLCPHDLMIIFGGSWGYLGIKYKNLTNRSRYTVTPLNFHVQKFKNKRNNKHKNVFQCFYFGRSILYKIQNIRLKLCWFD